MCIFPDCKTRANFNYEGKKGIYCSVHKLENMIDVNHKRCITPNCIKIPSCNYPNETKALYCSVHKLEGMVSTKTKHCITPNCIKLPTHNLPNKKPQYCFDHKTENMIDNTCSEEKCYLPHTTKINNKISYSYILKEGISEIKGGINVLCDMNYPQEIIDKTIKLL